MALFEPGWRPVAPVKLEEVTLRTTLDTDPRSVSEVRTCAEVMQDKGVLVLTA
jgi:hypothetical protein